MNKDVFKEFPVLETARLTLREIRSTDIDSIYSIYSDPRVAEFDYYHPIQSKDAAERIISNYEQLFKEHEEIRWAIALKENDLLIGTCGLGNFDFNANRCEIGYDLMYNYWNQGYMTEALEEMVSFGFEKLDIRRIEAFITPGNDASIRVLKKINFKEEGLVRERDFIKGQFVDSVVIAIIKKDYLEKRMRKE